MLKQPTLIEVAARNSTAEKITHKVYLVNKEKKHFLLAHLISEKNWHQVLVFTRTKHGANKLAAFLTKSGIPALAIHGNKSQSNRTNTLAKFKDGSLQVLVATDIAARGIDIIDLPHVVNFELPNVPEDYVHRIGRTGRAGQSGDAVSLVSAEERKLRTDIERVIKIKIPEEVAVGFEPTANTRSSGSSITDDDRGDKPNSGRSGRGSSPGSGQARHRTTVKPAGRERSSTTHQAPNGRSRRSR